MSCEIDMVDQIEVGKKGKKLGCVRVRWFIAGNVEVAGDGEVRTGGSEGKKRCEFFEKGRERCRVIGVGWSVDVEDGKRIRNFREEDGRGLEGKVTRVWFEVCR